jgi:DNA topoisomerase-1
LALKAQIFVEGCDYDIEGSLIGYSILKYACRKADVARRMRFSTLTKTELRKAYESLLPELDFGLIEAGKTRHEIDWLYGINLSRALTLSAKQVSGGYTPLSTGRVQGPTLNFLTSRDDAINCFVPSPYWALKAIVEIDGKLYEALYEKRAVKRKEDAEAIIEACRGKPGLLESIVRRILRQEPPPPFDFSTLQREAYYLFGLSPKMTGSIAEKLYLNALISYPRTSSQKLPRSIGHQSILEKLGRSRKYKQQALELLSLDVLNPKEGKKTDPAHPAIYPTGNLPKKGLLRRRGERELWDLIVKRFMAVFADAATIQSMTIKIQINHHVFLMLGRQILDEGWFSFYRPYFRLNEVVLPDVKEGDAVIVKSLECDDKVTMPPPRYNPSSLLKKMEQEEIGTKSTRANIIQTLYSRKYIEEESIKVTELGHAVTQILSEHVPTLVSPRLTRKVEEQMLLIQKEPEKKEAVLQETIKHLRPILDKLKSQTESIGYVLSKAVQQIKLQTLIIGKCPTCKTGKLLVVKSRKTGKRFVGCTNYFEHKCKTSYPLPQRGTIKPTKRICKACGKPMVLVLRSRKKPWILCPDPTCPKKRSRKAVEV